MVRAAFDVGGTFTDVVVIDAAGRLRSRKIANGVTSHDTASDVAAYALPGVSPGDPVDIDWRHASTVASNSVIEGSGPVVGLICTAGFRDTLEIRDLARPNVFDVRWSRTAPLITRNRRLGIRERTLVRDARPRVRPDLDEVDRVVEELRRQGVTSLALCLINAYLDPDHETTVAEHIRKRYADLPLSVSHELSAEAGEYERMSTTAVNASLVAVIGQHLDAIEAALPSPDGMLLMQSSGGVADLHEARRRPVHFLESGPAAGIVAAEAYCQQLEIDRAVALDMGGTTVKACIIEAGRAFVRDRAEVGDDLGLGARNGRPSGYPVQTPCFDVVELGAGGGSIAWVERGLLRVGPRSAGAVPGPACYQRGGVDATVTDANVVLGLLSQEALAAGTFPIDAGLAREAVAAVAAELGCALEEAAWGIRRVANATMVRAIRSVTIERGRDPRSCHLLTSGGSGALHAVHLAEVMGIDDVVVPPLAGVLSALGLLIAETRAEHIHSVRPVGLHADAESLRSVEAALVRAEDIVRRQVGHATHGDCAVTRFVQLRYGQQAESTRLLLAEGKTVLEEQVRLVTEFEDNHVREYGYRRDDDRVELVQVGAVASLGDGHFPSLEVADLEVVADQPSRPAYWGPESGWLETPVLAGRGVLAAAPVTGPAVIEEADTSIAVPPGWTARLTDHAVVRITRSGREQEAGE